MSISHGMPFKEACKASTSAKSKTSAYLICRANERKRTNQTGKRRMFKPLLLRRNLTRKRKRNLGEI